jgi:phosphomannomutase
VEPGALAGVSVRPEVRYLKGMTNAALETAVAQWIDGDIDEADRAELAALVAANEWAALADRFAGDLAFGTAGLRGRIEAGPNRMNRAVVVRATGAVADWLEADEDGRGGLVVLGRDGRRKSDVFLRDAAAVLVARGFSVALLDRPVPTPLVAFAARKLGAVAAIAITASHNPPDDNGYKLYDRTGGQIVSPSDERIAARIAALGPARSIPRADLEGSSLVRHLGAETDAAFLEAVAAAARVASPKVPFTVVYTPMHGVGAPFMVPALRAAGFEAVHVVPEQAEPDGTFPTVKFPNPEEKGALDLAFALARAKQADLVVASDPDADRLAIAIPDPTTPGAFVQLTGNEVGVLLAHHLFGQTPAAERSKKLVVRSIVSTPMLDKLAASHGARADATLTGFKWIARSFTAHRAEGLEPLFGFEEALGYCIREIVGDKDGIAAAVAFCDLARGLHAQGRTVLDALGDVYASVGAFASAQATVPHPTPESRAAVFAALEGLMADPPREVRGRKVVAVGDFTKGVRRTAAGVETRLALPKTLLVELEFEGGSRILVRPSGTEPKTKVYADVLGAPEKTASPLAAREAARLEGQAMADEIASRLRVS